MICPDRKKCKAIAKEYKTKLPKEYDKMTEMLKKCKPETCLAFKNKIPAEMLKRKTPAK